MSEIELKRANVVKRVDSEDKAKALEAKGFVRTDGTVTNKTESNAASEAVINELKEQLLKAGKVIEASDARRGELEKELTSTKENDVASSQEQEDSKIQIAVSMENLEYLDIVTEDREVMKIQKRTRSRR